MIFSMMEIRNNTVSDPFAFDEIVDVSELETLNNDIRQIDPVHVKGICTVDKDEVIFSFTIKGKMILPCARTLVDVTYPFEIKATEIFSTSASLVEEAEKDEIHLLTEDTLDLTPYIKENIVLETPYRVFSDEEVIEEGDGWAFYEEDQHKVEKETKIDPRLAKLQKLIDKNNKQKE